MFTWQAEELVQTAKEHGLLVSSGHYFDVTNKGSQCLRISLMAISDEAMFRAGLIQLASLIKRDLTSYESSE